MLNVSDAKTKAVLQQEEEAAQKPFGLKDKIAYMCGDFGNDFFFIMASSFLMVFYTNVLGIPGALVGTLFLVSRCVDAFTDIGMGRIVDRSKPTAEGRYRPWIKRMMLPVVTAGVLLFVPWVAELPYGVRVAYIFITYILWGSFCYTGINIPYGSMASAITDKPAERTMLSTFRSIGAALAGMIVGSVTPLFIYTTDAAGNQILQGNRVFMVACVFAILALICYTICYKWSTERIIVDNADQKQLSAKELVKALATNRALVSIIVAAIALLLAMLMTQSMNMYLYMDYFKNIGAMSVAGLLGTACTLLLAPFSGWITVKFGKKEASAAGLLFSAAIYAILFFSKITNAWVYCAFLLLANLGSGLFNLMIWAFISDIIDYQTVQTGSCDGGTIYGVYSFSRKIGQALAGGLGGFVISAIGYQVSTGGQAIVQTKEVTDAIYAVTTGVPAVGYALIALILIFWYPLSKKKVAEVKAKLDEMNKEVEESLS
ncbi:MFS transporter [uncultured Dubosiella sp.]|uniref:MFS transporter n=1 Tax=uncultured Dubosiella sp. TaxID=1937011 RepID=UPI0025B2AE00|nr:glycoside-pentoside-hexuronide (GPH):cation symporter [uncultured Dubosiella sp.]